MVAVRTSVVGPTTPLWIRRPGVLHLLAHTLAALVFLGQLVAVVLSGADRPTGLAVLVAGAGIALSWRWPWPGLLLTSAASFAVTAVGRDPVPVWMVAVLVLFSFTLRSRRPLVGTAVVALSQLVAFMSVGGFRGGAVTGVAALFSAIAGGASGAALRVYREHWWTMEERARTAISHREAEADRRVSEERLRIARDLHDVVAHQVAMLSVHLGVAEVALPDGAEPARTALASARSSGRTVIAETQRILALLRRGEGAPDDEALRPTPAVGGLAALIGSFESIGLVVTSSIELSPVPTSPSLGVTVYRIVQEGLTNAYRHGTGRATVEVRDVDGRIFVVVENLVDEVVRGRGTGGGLGLVGMRERVEASGGRLTIERSEGRFRVRAELEDVGGGS